MNQGIIVGCDEKQEWLLKWWWEHFSKHNNYPVAFVDFGMSANALSWCKTKGEVISIVPLLQETKSVPSFEKELWEIAFGKEDLTQLRSAWFKKPLAMISSPFPQSVWIDLDCEIRGNLSPLFDFLTDEIDIALTAEKRMTLFSPGDQVNYNSGVIVFKNQSDFLQKYVEATHLEKENYLGDQEILSLTIAHYETKVGELPDIYNWDWQRGPSEEALIFHYMRSEGKEKIRSLHIVI